MSLPHRNRIFEIAAAILHKEDRMFGKQKVWARVARVAVLPVFMLLPMASNAVARETAEVEGAGTEFLECTNTGWRDYNSCLMKSDFSWERKICDIVFEADVVWCGAVYYKRIKTGT
ncbi:MAG: hypothetical protein ABIV28_06055 [Longimicrobiales bacterium]